MKKFILLPAFVLAFASCKKDRVCVCTVSQTTTNPSGTHGSVETYKITYVDARKKHAKLACAHIRSTDAVSQNVTISSDSDCKLE